MFYSLVFYTAKYDWYCMPYSHGCFASMERVGYLITVLPDSSRSHFDWLNHVKNGHLFHLTKDVGGPINQCARVHHRPTNDCPNFPSRQKPPEAAAALLRDARAGQ